jgi:predicted peptidase
MSALLAAVVLLAPAQVPVKFVGSVTRQVSLDYLLALPEGYDERPDERWPLLLFLHGAGERGSDVQRVAVHGPLKEIRNGRKLPFVVVAPQCPEGQWWDAAALTALLDDLQNRYRIDPDRQYVTGLSMGGFGTWALAAANPTRFAAIAPICGGGNRWLAAAHARVPAWVTHGDADAVVPLAASQDMVEALKRAGGQPRFDVIAGGGHDVWSDFYARADFYEWLLSHRRPG